MHDPRVMDDSKRPRDRDGDVEPVRERADHRQLPRERRASEVLEDEPEPTLVRGRSICLHHSRRVDLSGDRELAFQPRAMHGGVVGRGQDLEDDGHAVIDAPRGVNGGPRAVVDDPVDAELRRGLRHRRHDPSIRDLPLDATARWTIGKAQR
jgi:hypothetical protein